MIRLEEINGKNVRELLALRVSDAQKSFVAPNDISIIICVNGGHLFCRNVYDIVVSPRKRERAG